MTPYEVHLAISAGLGDKDPTWDLTLAAIEGATMGACYINNIKSNKETIELIALQSLVDALERHHNGVV